MVSFEEEGRMLRDARTWKIVHRQNEQFGNHFIAKKDIAKDEIIGLDWPIFCVDNDPNRCSECSQTFSAEWVNPVPCKGHRRVCQQEYCSTTCRDKAWNNYHQAQCGTHLKKLVEMVRSTGNTKLNFVLSAAKIAAMYRFPEENQQQLQIMKLMLSQIDSGYLVERFGIDHIKYRVDLVRRSLLPDVGKKFIKMTLDKKFIRTLIATHSLYAFGMYGFSHMLGNGGFFNHSCEPNLIHTVDCGVGSSSMTITAIRDIKAGEQVFFSYIDVENLPPHERRTKLANTYRFFCECRVCKREAAPLAEILET